MALPLSISPPGPIRAEGPLASQNCQACPISLSMSVNQGCVTSKGLPPLMRSKAMLVSASPFSSS